MSLMRRPWYLLGVLPLAFGVAAASAAATAPTSAVRFPAGFGTPIYVGNALVYTPATVPTTAPPSTGGPSSTIPATTTTTTSTVAPSTTAPSATTVPSTTPSIPSCGLQKATSPAAFCETFDQPHNGGTRTGDLDPVLWGVSRLGANNQGQNVYNVIPDPSMTGCGVNAVVQVPADVRVCNGQLVDAIYDGHDVTNTDIYPKQPFDFAGRTGTAGFDVSNDSQGPHSAWPEFVITDKPVPSTRSDIGGTPPAAANEIGFTLDAGCGGTNDTAGVGKIFVVRNNAYEDIPFNYLGCTTRGTASALNHYEFRISTNHVEVWASDAGSTVLKEIASADNVGLTFTKGVAWMVDAHYNACKDGLNVSQCDHVFTWDNFGFDGPKTYRDLGFDVPDATVHTADGTATGFDVPSSRTFTVTGVHSDQTPTGALVVFGFVARDQNIVPSISINGGPPVDTASPFDAAGPLRSIAIAVPLTQVHDGTNTITISSPDGSLIVDEISLILVAASTVP